MHIARCTNCGRPNKVPDAASGTPRCGNCHQPLPWIADAGDDTFAEVAERADLPVLVDFWAEWCGPCKMVTPALEQVAQEMAGRVKLVKIEVDRSPVLSQRFTITGIPALMMLKEGRVAAQHVGAAPAAQLREWVEDTLRTPS
ncbi:thioredoxin [Planobispora siamensis]|uniref:Thioredoxin n=1 Tax=Planobispora siamensis TaxID=936338 RepID=A0A8J3SNT6_9ACTN|nr:thioredoxin [Planobispora siamensis]GIH97838.1 thiol reductase thioredoxin [Planobispora siamensis]